MNSKSAPATAKRAVQISQSRRSKCRDPCASAYVAPAPRAGSGLEPYPGAAGRSHRIPGTTCNAHPRQTFQGCAWPASASRSTCRPTPACASGGRYHATHDMWERWRHLRRGTHSPVDRFRMSVNKYHFARYRTAMSKDATMYRNRAHVREYAAKATSLPSSLSDRWLGVLGHGI